MSLSARGIHQVVPARRRVGGRRLNTGHRRLAAAVPRPSAPGSAAPGRRSMPSADGAATPACDARTRPVVHARWVFGKVSWWIFRRRMAGNRGPMTAPHCEQTVNARDNTNGSHFRQYPACEGPPVCNAVLAPARGPDRSVPIRACKRRQACYRGAGHIDHHHEDARCGIPCPTAGAVAITPGALSMSALPAPATLDSANACDSGDLHQAHFDAQFAGVQRSGREGPTGHALRLVSHRPLWGAATLEGTARQWSGPYDLIDRTLQSAFADHGSLLARCGAGLEAKSGPCVLPNGVQAGDASAVAD